jgi:hypothetical protein
MFAEAVQREGKALLELKRRDADRPVPTCPGWRVGDLVSHMDEMTRTFLSEAGVEPSGPGLASALDALRAGDLPHDELRSLALEMSIHRWDADNAFGDPAPLDPDLACDGIEEFFTVALPGLLQHRGQRAGTGQTVHLHRTDGEGEWMITLNELPEVTHEHGKGDAAVRGTASDLLLSLWGRIDPPEAFGDTSILDHLREFGAH